MPPSTYSLRLATTNDVETIVRHRKRMIHEIREASEKALSAMGDAFAEWVRPKIEGGEYLAWFAITEDGSVAAGAGLWLLDWPAHILPSGIPGGQRAYLLNVYTEEAHRNQGLSRMVVTAAVDWCKANEIGMISLHASQYGKHLYETLEFTPTSEMRLVL
jgi:GNAT superfamily N-acetyltransferase